MKTTITPAQITTVEDKIAGNMTFTQILFLIIPLITATAIYGIAPPRIQLSAVKIVLMVLQFAIFLPLALRIKSKTLAEWLVIITRYRSRPRIYTFTKNDLEARELVQEKSEVIQTAKEATKDQELIPSVSFADQTKIEQLLKHPAMTIRLGKKGGIDVALSQED